MTSKKPKKYGGVKSIESGIVGFDAPKPKKKTRKVKAWGILCDKSGIGMCHATDKDKVKSHAKFLNEEYGGYCKHRVIPVTITYTL